MSPPMVESRTQSSKKEDKTPSWRALRSIFSCKHYQTATVVIGRKMMMKKKKHNPKIGCSGSLCSLKESSRVMQRPEPNSPEAFNSSSRSLKVPSTEFNSAQAANNPIFSSSSSISGSFRRMNLRRISGCHECHMVLDPAYGVSMDPSLRTPTIFSCSECEEIFTKAESLELHQSLRHAVSVLGLEEASRNILEIIFQSSWLKNTLACKITRILKINNTKKTISRFEDYRSSIITKANKLSSRKHPRCTADGNELLRFHSTTFKCSLGVNGATNLCNSIPQCDLCSIIQDGFKAVNGEGMIRTMATSGRAHDVAEATALEKTAEEERAMLICRVIAGRVKKRLEAVEEWDSVGGGVGVYSSLDELFVVDSMAILPCFVVVYKGFFY